MAWFSGSSKKELYLFRRGEREWRYTSAETFITIFGKTFVPAAISRGNLDDAGDTNKETFTVTLPLEPELSDLDDLVSPFLSTQSYLNKVFIDIIEYFNGQSLVLRKGSVQNTKIDSTNGTITLNCITSFSRLIKMGIQTKVQRTCSHVVYSEGCGVKEEDHAVTGIITNITGGGVEITYTTDNQKDFTNGFIKKDGIYTRILGDDGSGHCTLFRPHIGLEIGDSVTLLVGCDQSLNTCDQKFNNHLNFNGFPWMPKENPVGNNAVK